MDTHHLEHGLRPIPMGRRNSLFAWTERAPGASGHAIRRPGRSAETNLLRHRPGRIQHLQPRVNYGLVWPLTLFRTIGLSPDAGAAA